MSVLVTPLAIALALIFAASAAGKALAPDRGARAFDALRITAPWPRTAGTVLIALEAVAAIGLVVTTAWWLVAAAALTLVLAIGLLVTVWRASRLGSDDDCGCFGEWMPARIGPWLIARNGGIVLAALALFAAALSSAATSGAAGVPVAVASAFTGAPEAALAVLATVLISLLVWLITRAARPEAAAPAPASERPSGHVLRLTDDKVIDVLSYGDRARLAVFMKPGCGACTAVHELVDAESESLTRIVEVYAVFSRSSGSLDSLRETAVPRGAHAVVDVGDALSRVLDAGMRRPVAALISTSGELVGPIAKGSAEISELVGNLVAVANGATE